MDLVHAWAQLGVEPKLAFLWVLGAVATTIVRGCRLWTWSRWASRVEAGAAVDAGTLRARYLRARRLARSTRGLALAAIWLTCSGGAVALIEGTDVIENSSRPILAAIAEGVAEAVDVTAVAFWLCALLLILAWIFGLVVDRSGDRLATALTAGPGQTTGAVEPLGVERLRRRVDRVRGGLSAAGVLAVADALSHMRPAYVAEAARGENMLGWAVYHALWLPWPRLAIACGAIGVLVWLSVLVEGIVARRLAVRPLASGGTPSGF